MFSVALSLALAAPAAPAPRNTTRRLFAKEEATARLAEMAAWPPPVIAAGGAWAAGIESVGLKAVASLRSTLGHGLSRGFGGDGGLFDFNGGGGGRGLGWG